MAGALFAVNRLVAREGGSTFTFDELREDLQRAGVQNPTLMREDEGVNSILTARK